MYPCGDVHENTYVERNFAKLKDLLQEMNSLEKPVLFYTGPSGTGKTTTLTMLYRYMQRTTVNGKFLYIDAKYDYNTVGVAVASAKNA